MNNGLAHDKNDVAMVAKSKNVALLANIFLFATLYESIDQILTSQFFDVQLFNIVEFCAYAQMFCSLPTNFT